MTQDEIIRSPIGREQLVALAREAGLLDYTKIMVVEIERFAALVAANEREKQPEHFAKAIAELVECCRVLAEENEAAVLAEREACAKVAEEEAASWARLNAQDEEGYGAIQCAAAIRKRGMDLLTQHSQAIGEYNDYP